MDSYLHCFKQRDNGDMLTKKGDFVLSSDHVIEIVAKTALLVQNATGQKAPVFIGTQWVQNMVLYLFALFAQWTLFSMNASHVHYLYCEYCAEKSMVCGPTYRMFLSY